MKKHRKTWLFVILFIAVIIYGIYNANYKYVDIDKYSYCSEYITSKARAKHTVITNDEQAKEVFYQEKEKFKHIANCIINNQLDVGWEIYESKNGVEILNFYNSYGVTEYESIKVDIIYLFEKYNIVRISSYMYTVSGVQYYEIKFNYNDSYDFLYTDNVEYAVANDEYITPINENWNLSFFPYSEFASMYTDDEDEYTESDESESGYVITDDEHAKEVFRKERDKFENIVNYITSNEMDIDWGVMESERGVEVFSLYCNRYAFISDETVKADIIYLFEQYGISYIDSDIHTYPEYLYNDVEFKYSSNDDFLYTDDPENALYEDEYNRHIEDCWYLKFFPYGI